MFPTNSECLISISDAFSAFVYGYLSSCPRAQFTPNKSVTTLRYTRGHGLVLGDSGGVVNSLYFCPASLKSLGCFYSPCVLSSQWKAVTVNLRILIWWVHTIAEVCNFSPKCITMRRLPLGRKRRYR